MSSFKLESVGRGDDERLFVLANEGIAGGRDGNNAEKKSYRDDISWPIADRQV